MFVSYVRSSFGHDATSETHSKATFSVSISPTLQCHSSFSKSLQQCQCNSGQLTQSLNITQQTNTCNDYHMTQLTHVPRRPCLHPFHVFLPSLYLPWNQMFFSLYQKGPSSRLHANCMHLEILSILANILEYVLIC